MPSESSVGTMSSTNSSEVSRPVSLTSLGSCSSSGSSGPQQPGSTYLASAESLDSDNEHGGQYLACNSTSQRLVSPSPRHRATRIKRALLSGQCTMQKFLSRTADEFFLRRRRNGAGPRVVYAFSRASGSFLLSCARSLLFATL